MRNMRKFFAAVIVVVVLLMAAQSAHANKTITVMVNNHVNEVLHFALLYGLSTGGEAQAQPTKQGWWRVEPNSSRTITLNNIVT